MDHETLPMNLEDSLKALWRRENELLDRVMKLTRQEIMRGHDIDALYALYHGLVSENQALRLRVMELEDIVKELVEIVKRLDASQPPNDSNP